MSLLKIYFGVLAFLHCFDSNLVNSDILYVQDHVIRVGVDTSIGCAVTHLSSVENVVNLINSYDYGREIQASFYSGPESYEGCAYHDRAWPWNPIGSGDKFRNPSKVLEANVEGNEITCKVIPMQWACDNIPCECTFHLTYSVGNGELTSTVTLHNHRKDKTDYGLYSQEMPSVYTNGFLYRIIGYQGSQPWTNSPLTEWNAGSNESHKLYWRPGMLKEISENWLALVAKDDFAVGLYTGNSDVTEFHCGFAGKIKGKGGEKDFEAGYMAPVGLVSLPGNTTYTYTYKIIIGNVHDIRARVYHLHRGAPIFSVYHPTLS